MVDTSSLAIITARRNSKRLPGKNLLKIGGQTLLERSIEFSIETGYNTLVSTDCSKMREISLQNGVLCPWLRPGELATDSAKSVDVVLHALNWYEKNISNVSRILLLQPTSPFRKIDYFREAHQTLVFNENIDSLVSVSPNHHSPFWNFYIRNGIMHPVLNFSGVNIRSQDLEQSYHLNGNLYLIKRNSFIEQRRFITERTKPIVMNEKLYSFDIDDEFDYQLAKLFHEEISNGK